MILHQNYPNPFNSTTTIEFQVAHTDVVTLEIFNIAGQRVRSLIDHVKLVGVESVEWDGTNVTGESVASGVYLYRLSTDDDSRSKKILFLK